MFKDANIALKEDTLEETLETTMEKTHPKPALEFSQNKPLYRGSKRQLKIIDEKTYIKFVSFFHGLVKICALGIFYY